METTAKENVPGPSGDTTSVSASTVIAESTVLPNTGAIKKKRDDKKAKRDPRSWDNLIKSVNSLSDTEKLEIIKDKYTELYNEYRTTVTAFKTSEKNIKNLLREKEHIQADLAKNILTRAKLENLARELQRQNKEIKEENHNRLKEEEEKRKEVAANFTEKLNALTQLMDESKDKSLRLRDENLNMTTKLTELYEQFQVRESHLTKMGKQMELQKKLSDTQLKKLEYEFETEKEIWKKEKNILLTNLQRSQETTQALQDNVKNLQEHLDTYQKQYSDFESTMKRSNKVFDSFKDEMSKMQKNNSTLEKDCDEWKVRWKGATQKCLQLTELNQASANELKSTQKKLEALEKLCRKLQTERAYYLQQLKLNNISTVIPAEDGPSNAPVKSESDEPRAIANAIPARASQSEPSLTKSKEITASPTGLQSPASTSDLTNLEAASPRIPIEYLSVSPHEAETDEVPKKEDKTEE